MVGVFIVILLTSNPKSQEPVLQVNVDKVFDLDSLYGKNIDQIVTILGKPASDTEPTQLQKQVAGEIKEWDKTFIIDSQTLVATYNPSTRKVIDFFISTKDPSGATKDVSSIIKIAGSPSADKFTTKPVGTMRDKGIYTGVIFTPNK